MLTTIALAAVTKAGPPLESALTIYNDGFALVREQRMIDLAGGPQDVLVEDVAQMIEANSVSVTSLSAPGSFSVLEQNYQYDLINPIAILNKSVGQPIRFHRNLANGTKETIYGTLISAPFAMVADANGSMGQTYNGMVVRTDSGGILLNPTGEIEVLKLPEGLISKPSLLWVLDGKAGSNRIEFRYLTQGFSWKCDYVMTLDNAGKVGDLKGWVTLTNNSGTSYENAKLSFLAGEVNRYIEQRGGFGGGGGMPAMNAAAKMEDMAAQEIGEYHLYKMSRSVNVPNKAIKQVSLMEHAGIKVRTKLIADLGPFYNNPRQEGRIGSGPIKPMAFITFKNEEANGLGIAMPKGTFKVFQADKDGDVQLMGEDFIQHTPRNEELNINIGKSFDVVVESKVVEFRWLNGNPDTGSVITIEFEARNRKKEATELIVMDRKYGDFTVTSEDAMARPDSNTLQWVLKMQPDEVKKVRYTVTTRW